MATAGKLAAVTRVVYGAGFGVALAAATFLGWRVARNQVAGEIYKERLKTLAHDYEALRQRYNEAVRRTAVTELVVQDGELSLRIVDASGEERVIETPYDPSREVYVDYVVVQGRLWIRRVFDAKTAPGDGLVITPPLEGVDWSDPRFAVGKAVYRALGEGRWVVTVTGDGSLGLARAERGEPARLTAIPEVREYDEMERAIAVEIEGISATDVVRSVIGRP